MSTTPRFALTNLPESGAAAYMYNNLNLAKLDSLIGANVVNRVTAAPPGSPAEGDCYLIAASATGAWVGKDNYFTYLSGGGWKFVAPKEGMVLWVHAESASIVYNGSAWVVNGSGTVSSVALTMPGVFSVAGSPVTSSGTLAVTLATQSANSVWAGPSSGGAAAPTFRSLVAADIPTIPQSGVSTLVTDLAAKAPLASPALTGTPTAPTASPGTNTTQLATCAFVLASAGSLSHIVGTGSTPGIAAGAGAGTSPTIVIAGTDLGGKVTLTTGTIPTGSAVVFTVTFASAFAAAPFVVFSAANANAAALSGLTMVFVTSTTTTFVFTVGATGLAGATQYIWNYHVAG